MVRIRIAQGTISEFLSVFKHTNEAGSIKPTSEAGVSCMHTLKRSRYLPCLRALLPLPLPLQQWTHYTFLFFLPTFHYLHRVGEQSENLYPN